MTTLLQNEINNKQLVNLYYDGGYRTIEPHCLGMGNSGNYLLRAFQISGHSNSGKRRDWKLLDLKKIRNCVLLDQKFQHSRIGYVRGDSAMRMIYAEL